MTQEALVHLIEECCQKHPLSCHNLSPTQVSPGIWQFNAVEMDDSCSKHGHCRQMRYYGRLLDNTIELC